MMSLWDALRMNMMISYQELVRTFLRFFASGAFGPARRSPNRSTDFSDEAVGLPNSVDFVVVQATRSNGITDDKRRAERIVDVLWEYDRSTS
ncbi:hypothetical protein R5N22_005852 [Raoultella ornithinolytica]|nr:hypothetical protein [Raoultella ornithinolytica]